MFVGPLDRSRLSEVIVGPARKGGFEFSHCLVERMVEDTRGGDALPLLAYTLRELYDRPRPDPHLVSGADYDAIAWCGGRAPPASTGRSRTASRATGVADAAAPLVTANAEGERARRRLAHGALDPAELDVAPAFVDPGPDTAGPAGTSHDGPPLRSRVGAA
ncbi:MAG TPA: hypothetical protein VFY45_14510, partial [Baekduia sp.]|nr:hypothetical protein [Baekduia sp.]